MKSMVGKVKQLKDEGKAMPKDYQQLEKEFGEHCLSCKDRYRLTPLFASYHAHALFCVACHARKHSQHGAFKLPCRFACSKAAYLKRLRV